MNSQQELFDLLDKYASGTLTQAESILLEDRLKDPETGKEAARHVKFAEAMRFYAQRLQVKQQLEVAHLELEKTLNAMPSIKVFPARRPGDLKKYWGMTAVAASVALVSVLGTLIMTRKIETKQSVMYKELRRNVEQVEQIKKSQNLIMAGIAESSKEKRPHFTGKYAGTGFLISPNGYLATSYHVIKGADSVYIENERFGRLKASVLFSNAGNDVAILSIEGFEPLRNLPYTISAAEADLGEQVFTLGFPREDIVFGEGSISASTGYRQNPNAYQVSVPVNPGNSGGPLLNTKGDLIGIISGIQTETSGAAFAIKSGLLLDAIKQATADSLAGVADSLIVKRPMVLPRQNLLKSNTRVQQIKKWEELVFMVGVYNNN